MSVSCFFMCCFVNVKKQKIKETAYAISSIVSCIRLSSFYFSGTQAGSTYIHLLCSTILSNSNGFNVRLPHSIWATVWVAHILSEMSTFTTYCTFCHVYDTSLKTHLSLFKDLQQKIFYQIVNGFASKNFNYFHFFVSFPVKIGYNQK